MDKRTSNNQKMKICHFGQRHPLSDSGGVEVVVRELSTRQAKIGHEVICYNRGGSHVSGKEYDRSWRKLKEYKGVRMKSVPTINRKGLAAVSSSFFASLCVAFGNYDVVHIHAEGPAAFCWIPKLFGKRVICHNHGIDWKRAKWKKGFASKYIRFGEKCSVKFADEIIVLSENAQKYFMDTYGRKTVFIPNGVDKPQIREADEINQRWNLEKDNYILFLGRLVPEKGLRYLVEAYSGLDTDKKLVIAGGESDTPEFMEELKNSCENFGDRVVFTGFVQGEVLNELYSNAYIYVLPSNLEGMPLSLLEAMSYGNCCVVSDIEECVSVVQDNDNVTEDRHRAVIFKKGNVKDLQDKLQMLCDYEEMVQKYRTGTADFICKKYSWDSTASMILSLYRKAGIWAESKAYQSTGYQSVGTVAKATKHPQE